MCANNLSTTRQSYNLTKGFLLIIVLMFIAGCKFDFGKSIDSKEATKRLRLHLKLDDQESISDVDYFIGFTGIDPDYVARFRI